MDTGAHGMTAAHAALPAPAATRPLLVQALRVVAALLPLVILVQAFFVGRGLFLDSDLIDVHGVLGNVTLLLVIVQTVLVLFAGLRGRMRIPLIAISVLLVVLVCVQLALGYSDRDSGQAAAWHVPNGVLIFGLGLGFNARVNRYRRESAAP
jgi:hypothetical protein